MKKIAILAVLAVFLTSCSYFSKQSTTPPPPVEPLPSALTTTDAAPVIDGNIHNILITQNNFGTEEITVLQDETLILSVRNQLEEPINVVIDELGVRSEEIEFGELVEISVPTDKPGEYEMYSSLGNQRNEGFSAVIIVGEGSLEE